MTSRHETPPVSQVYQRIYELVCAIPRGQVASYGQIATLEGHCGPRQVGYALAALGRSTSVRAQWSKVPWQRVVNARGMLSPRRDGEPVEQAILLRKEGVQIDARGRIDLDRHRWRGPEIGWLLEHGFEPPQQTF